MNDTEMCEKGVQTASMAETSSPLNKERTPLQMTVIIPGLTNFHTRIYTGARTEREVKEALCYNKDKRFALVI